MKLQTVRNEFDPASEDLKAKTIGKKNFDAEKNQDQSSSPIEDDLASHRFECRDCGYIYDPKEGLKKFKISKGTSFFDIDKETFRCPVCRSSADAYKDIGAKFQPSDGFEENISYGFGFNTLPPGQKNVLIFGGLAFAAACFLSLYSLH